MELVKLTNPDRFVFRCTFDEKEIPKTARFRWNPELREWWTGDDATAAKLSSYCIDPILKCRLEERFALNLEARRAAIAASRATDAAIEIPRGAGAIEAGEDYMPYQKAGVAALAAKHNTLLGDEMGLGKTIQAIGLMNIDPTIANVLVVCPASLKINWKREFEKWIARPMTAAIASTQKCPMADVTFINFEALFEDDPEAIEFNRLHHKSEHKPTVRLRHPELSRQFDVLFVDECHRIKNSKAKRTMAVNQIRARRRVYMTGTPIVNRPAELWPLLVRLDPDTWTFVSKRDGKRYSKFREYARRFCDWAGAGKPAGASNLDELQTILRSTVLVRRLKAEVLADLPPKMRKIVVLDDNSPELNQQQLDREHRIAGLHAAVEVLEAELKQCDDKGAMYKAVAAQLRAARGIAFSELSLARHEEALAMLPQAIEFVKEAGADPAHKIVVFGWHQDVLEGLKQALGDRAVLIYGPTELTDRQAAVDRFQTDPDCQFLVGSITAAGVGFTMTAASHVIFVEEDWVPGNITQAEDRCHRIGQRDSVLVQHLVLDHSICVKMIKMCLAKQEIANKTLDIMAEVKDIVESRPIFAPTPPAKASPVRRVAAAVTTMSETERRAVHEALNVLAGACDGARSKDGYGFSKFDAAFGRSLAQTPLARFTVRQAMVGRRIVRKYRKQLDPGLYARIAGAVLALDEEHGVAL